MEIRSVFPTLVGRSSFPDCGALNASLAAYIENLERSTSDRSPFSTVRSGWQSDFTLLEHAIEPIAALRGFINVQVEEFLAAWGAASFTATPPKAFSYDYTGWAVVLRDGGYQHEHVHTNTTLVGVYYVAVPERASGGELTLVDPRAGRLATRTMWDTSTLSIRPEPGLLVLFPSFLPHRVDSLVSDGPRISINFDVTLRPAG